MPLFNKASSPPASAPVRKPSTASTTAHHAEPPVRPARPADDDTSGPLLSSSNTQTVETKLEGADHVRRKSFFARRSRSDAVACSASQYMATPSPMASDMSLSRRSPPPAYSMNSTTSSWASDRNSDDPKSFFSRHGKRIRRHTSKFSLTSLSVGHEDVEESAGWRNHQEGVWACRRDKAEIESARIRAMDRNAFSRRSDRQAERLPELLKKRKISEPFNFQHITHTSRGQFPELHRISPNELTNEFSAARAAQSPRPELRGIEAEDLHFKNFSSDALGGKALTSEAPSPAASSPPVSPRDSRAVFKDTHFQIPEGIASALHSADTSPLTTPVSPRSPAMQPPPRTSSMAAITFSYNNLTPRPRARPSLQDQDKRGIDAAIRRSGAMMTLADIPRRATTDGVEEPFAHAVTTPDDSAWQLHAPFVDPPVEEIPEPEDPPTEESPPPPAYAPDRSNSRQSSSRQSNSRRSTHSASSVTGLGLRQTKSVSDLKAVVEHDPLPIGSALSPGLTDKMQRPVSQMSDTLGGPFSPPPAKNQAGGSEWNKRLSIGVTAVDGCWEDDIDYCYEHAAEADCEFPWDNRSLDERSSEVGGFDLERVASGSKKQKRKVVIPPDTPPLDLAIDNAIHHVQEEDEEAEAASMEDPLDLNAFTKTVRPCLIVPPHAGSGSVNVEASPAGSSSTDESEALTPSEPVMPARSLHADRAHSFVKPVVFGMDTAILPAHEFESQVLQESMYQDLLQDHEAQQDYGFYAASVEPSSVSATDSFRSSNTLSKCNSEDSIALAITTATARAARGSVNSASSLPELVYSRNRRNEFDAAVDGLAENIASLKTVEEVASNSGQSSPHDEDEVSCLAPRAPSSSPAVRRARARSDAAVRAHSVALRSSAGSAASKTNLRPISAAGSLAHPTAP